MMTMTEELVITKHAYTRMKERNGWNKKAATRMVSRIYSDGVRPEQVKGYLKKWVNTKYEYMNDGDEYVLFGDKLYIFNGMTMLTVFPIPTRSFLYSVA